mmetsp:Transcript_6919/g.16950  ORF Transcript_6919/g.16950 Transcript_6919/m.16950 type:complete len:399 (+) Transcript_6919:467-1663(+)
MAPMATTCWTWSLLMQRLEIAHAASSLTSHWPQERCWITSDINRGSSSSAWICCLFPAAIFEMSQQVSFLKLFFGCCRRGRRFGRIPASKTTWVCSSVPVTTLPSVLKAGATSDGERWPKCLTRDLMTSFCSRRMSMRSFSPSVMYENAQQASISVSSSVHWRRMEERSGTTFLATSIRTTGFPRQRFESVHTVFLRRLRLAGWRMLSRTGSSAPASRTRSRSSGQSPATFPRHHADCSRTSALWDVRSPTRGETQPACTAAFVKSVDAMFVSAQAASNWSSTDWVCFNASISGASAPASTAAVAGGFATERSFRRSWAALYRSKTLAAFRLTMSRGRSSRVGCCSLPAAPPAPLISMCVRLRMFRRLLRFSSRLDLRRSSAHLLSSRRRVWSSITFL